MISSAIPSARYSWSFFSLMSVNGSTAMDFSEIAAAAGATVGIPAATGCSVATSFDGQNLSTPNRRGQIAQAPRPASVIPSAATSAIVRVRLGRGARGCAACGGASGTLSRYARTGLEMFLSACSPRSSHTIPSLLRTCSSTAADRQIAPGSASVCSRAATFTPSPNSRPSSRRTSPRCAPIRKRMRRASGSAALRAASTRWISIAHSTASRAAGNSARKLSPVKSARRPRCSAIRALTCSRQARSVRTVPSSSSAMRRE